MGLEWMYWTLPTAIFFTTIFLMICGMLVWELVSPTIERRGFSDDSDHPRDEIFFGVARQCLYPSRVARIHGFGAVDLRLLFQLAG